MNEILFAVISVMAIGIVCAVVLVVASKLMAVEENEKVAEIRECLPGANCGACGFAGCDGYAKALGEGESTKANLCVPGGAEVNAKISEILGVEVEETVKKVAVVHCMGDCNKTGDKVEYKGIKSCKAAKLIYSTKGDCPYGCIGFGDCAAVCPNDAVCIADGIAHISAELCVGCGLCAKACPNSLISLAEVGVKPVVSCSNNDKGAMTRKACQNGCIGCRKCVKVCPLDAITVENNLAVIDTSKCAECPDFGICARECTTGCIVLADLS